MYKVKKTSNPFYIESNQAFRQVFLTNLNKLSETATKKTGLDEIRDLLINHVQDADRINLVLTLLSETGDHQKATGKRESMKVIGLMAEVFEDRLAGYLPKILNIMSKKLKENDPQVHDTLSASLGNLVNFTLRNLDMDTAYKSLESIFQMLFQLCSRGNRYTQIGAAMSITKTIQSCSFEFLYLMVDEISLRIIEVLRQHTCKAHIQLFECLLSLVLVFEGNSDKLHQSAKIILPVAIDNLTNGDWNVRKIAVEVIYTLSVIIPEAIIPYKHEILEVLGHCRFDKIKNVRESATTAIARLKELGDPDVPVKLINYQNEYCGDEEEMGTATFNTKTYTNESDIYQVSNTVRSELQGQQGHGHSQSVKWARSSPQREKSTSRPHLKMNPEFFSNAPKHRGDIEIYTKSPPPKSLLVEPETAGGSGSKLKSGRGEPQVEVVASPNRTFKYTITGQNQNAAFKDVEPENETNYVQGYENKQEQQAADYENQNQESEAEARESLLSAGGQQRSRGYREEREGIREERASMENSRQMVEEAPKRNENSGDKRLTSGEKRRQQTDDYDDHSSRPKPKQSSDDFAAVFKQLANISEQQSTMMQSLTSFQNNTYTELDNLKNRVKQLEDIIQSSKSTPNYPPYHPPHTYPYMPPYQPYGQPPPVHNMYPVQYSNYAPPNYPPQGQGHGQGVDTRRRPETSRPENGQNYYSSRGGEHPSSSSSYGQTQGKSSTSKSSRDKGPVSYGGQNTHPGQRMEQEYSSTTRERARQDSKWENKETSQSVATTRDERVKTSPQTRGRRSARKQALWDRIQESLRRNDVASGYEVCLNEGDEETLIDLMHETGNIVHELDSVLVENLLVNMKSRIFDEENRDMMLSWVENTLLRNVQVSRGTFIALHDVIVQLLGEGAKVSTLQQQRVKKLVNDLQTMLDDTMPVEKNLNREIDQTENLGDDDIDEGDRIQIK